MLTILSKAGVGSTGIDSVGINEQAAREAIETLRGDPDLEAWIKRIERMIPKTKPNIDKATKRAIAEDIICKNIQDMLWGDESIRKLILERRDHSILKVLDVAESIRRRLSGQKPD